MGFRPDDAIDLGVLRRAGMTVDAEGKVIDSVMRVPVQQEVDVQTGKGRPAYVGVKGSANFARRNG